MNQQDRLAPPSAAAAARLGQPSQESRSGGEDTRLGPRPAEAKQTNTNLNRTTKMTTRQRGNRCRDNFLLQLSLFIVLQIILLTTSGHQYFSRQPETQTIRRGLASAQFLFTYEINQESDDSRAPKSSLFDPSSFKIVTPSQLASSYQKLASQLPEQAPQTPGSSQSFLQEAQQQQQQQPQPVAASPATPTGESLATPSNPSSSFLKQTSAAIQSFAELFHLTPSSSPAPLGGAAAVSPPQQAAASTGGLDQQAEARSLHEHWTQQQQRAHQPNHHHLAAAFQSFTTSPSVVQQQPSSQASIGRTSNQQPSSQASYWLTSNPLSGPDGNFLVEIKSNSNQQQASTTQSELQPPGGHLVDNLLSLSHPGQQNQQQNNHLQHLHNQHQQQPTPTTTVSSLRESRPSSTSAQSSFLATPTSYYPAPKPALQAAPTPVSTPVVPTTTTTTSTTTTTAQQQVQQAQQNFNHPHQQKHFQPQTQALHQHQARSLQQQQQQHRQPQQTHARLSSNSFRPSELLEGGHQLQPPANAPEHFGGGGNSYTPSPSAHHHQHNHLKSAEESLIAFRQQQQDQAVSAPQEPRGNSLLAGDDEPAPLPVTPQSSHRHAHHHHQHSDPLSESHQQQPPRASAGLTLTKPAHHTNTYSVVPQQQQSRPQPTAHEIPKVSPQIYESFLLQQKDQYEKHMELLKQQQELNKLLEQKQKREREREREGSEERGKKLAQQQRKKEELERQEQRKRAAAREQEQAQAARKARLERQQQQQQQEAEEAARRKLARQRQEEEEQRRYRELVEAREREEKLRAQAEAEALAARRQREQQEREAAETRRRQEEAAREEEAAKQEAAKQYRAYLRQQEELKKLLELKQKEDEAAEARRRQVAAAEKEKEQQAAAAVSRSRSTSAARANKLALEHKERARQQQQQATNAQAIQRQSAQQVRGETTTWGGRATRARPIAAELPSGNLLTPTSATAATPANEPEVTSALYSPSSSTQAASTATATSTQRPPESTTGVARVGARLPAANTRQAAEPMRRLRADEKLIRQKIPLYSGAGKYGLYSKADSDELAKLLEAVNLPTSASSTTTTTTTTTSTTTTTTPAPVTSSSLQDDEAARDTATERALYASRMASSSLSPLLNLRELSVTPSSLQVSGGSGGGRAAPTGEPFSSTTIFDDDVPRRRVVVRARPAQSSSSQSRGPLSFNISPAASQTSSTRVNSAAAVALSHRSGQSATPTPSAPSRNATHQGANGRAASIGLASLPADSDNDGIPGRAGHEYPVLAEVPQTSFSCSKQPLNGYYADTETACQVVHLCQGGQQSSILCPNGTIFNQEKFSCQWWYEVNCARAPMFYQLNDNLYKAAAAVASGDSTPKLDDLRRSSSSGGGGSNRSQL